MEKLENKILDISAKLGNEVHLSAIRNTFISMLPIMIFGGLFAVIGSAPATEDATGFMRVWADFVASNSKIFSCLFIHFNHFIYVIQETIYLISLFHNPIDIFAFDSIT